MKICGFIFLFLISIESNGYNGSPSQNRYMPENGHWVVKKKLKIRATSQLGTMTTEATCYILNLLLTEAKIS